jgi:hypothetical protein
MMKAYAGFPYVTANLVSKLFSELHIEEKNHLVSCVSGLQNLELCCHYGIYALAKDESLVETDGSHSLFYRVNNVTLLCDNRLLFELIQNQRLQLLNLSLTFLSHNDVKLLCDVLNQAECNIEKLM